MENAATGILVSLPEGPVLSANRAALALFGYDSEEDIGKTPAVDLFANPDDRQRLLSAVDKEGVARAFEVHMKRKDGTSFWASLGVTTQAAETGERQHLTLVEDLTDRKQAETALRESEERYRALFEQSLDAIWLARLDGTGNIVNRAWLEMFGYEREDIPSLNAKDLYVDPEERALFLRRIVEVGAFTDEVRFKRKDGSVFDCERAVIALRDATGHVVRFQGVMRDVTARKRAEAALRASEERFRGVFEHGPMGIAIVDTTAYRFVRANRAYLQIVGYTEEELMQLHISDVTAPDDRERQQQFVQARVDAGHNGYAIETRYVRKNGELRDVLVVGELLRLAQDSRPLVIANVLDITDRKRAEKRLAESREDLRLLAQRVEKAREDERTTIARELHDRVGQTLTALRLDIDRVKRTMETARPETLSLLAGMEEMVIAGADDVRRISSELRPGALDDLGLAGAIEWQLDQLRQRSDITFAFTCGEVDRGLDASRTTALFRVFQELVTNVVRHAGAKRADVSLQVADGVCVLTVLDDGCGIDVRQISDRHSLGIVGMRERLLPYGGELHIEGAPGKGTTARVIMPLQ